MSFPAFLQQYGILAVYIGAIFEGETFAILGGAFVHQGIFSPISAFLAVAGGTFTADQSAFWAGRLAQKLPLVQKMMATSAFQKAQAALTRNPTAFVLTVRFAYGMRTAGALAIGTSNYPALRYVVLDLIAILIWSLLFVSLGYIFAFSLKQLFGEVEHAEKLIGAILVLVVAVGLGRYTIQHRRKAQPGN